MRSLNMRGAVGDRHPGRRAGMAQLGVEPLPLAPPQGPRGGQPDRLRRRLPAHHRLGDRAGRPLLEAARRASRQPPPICGILFPCRFDPSRIRKAREVEIEPQ